MQTKWTYNQAKLKEVRAALGLTIDETAKRLGVRLQQYHQWEAGPMRPNIGSLCRICNAFGMAPKEFFKEEQE